MEFKLRAKKNVRETGPWPSFHILDNTVDILILASEHLYWAATSAHSVKVNKKLETNINIMADG